MHHYPWKDGSEDPDFNMNFTKPKPKVVLQWLKETKATLLLCGHTHCIHNITKRKFWNTCKVLRAGTAGGIDEDDNLRAYHIIDLFKNGKTNISKLVFDETELL